MKILALRLAGPMQSWGASSLFTKRATEAFPTKSGVLGMIASAMGIERDNTEELARISNIDIVVREDRRGRILRDYHTVEVSPGKKSLSDRFYIADASFLVGVTGDEGLLVEMSAALASPKNAPFLGRRSFAPTSRVLIGMDDYDSVDEFFLVVPVDFAPSASRNRKDAQVELSTWVTDARGGLSLMDSPVSFSSASRRYAPRVVAQRSVKVDNPFYRKPVETADTTEGSVPYHDPMSILEGASDVSH